MSSVIEHHARKLIEAYEGRLEAEMTKIHKAVEDLRKAVAFASADEVGNNLWRDEARLEYGEGGRIEIDSDAVISKEDGSGAYVAAWVWVQSRECDECGEPNGHPSRVHACEDCVKDRYALPTS